jgi:hypothetical protein
MFYKTIATTGTFQKKDASGNGPAIINSYTEHAMLYIVPALNAGRLPDVYPYQLQADMTRFCAHWARYQKNRDAPKDCKQCACPDKSTDHVPLEHLQGLLRNFESHGGRSLYMTGGGEPGNYKYLKSVLEYFSDSSLGLTLNTNGDFIDRIQDYDPVLLKKVFSKDKEAAMISVSIHNDLSYMATRKLRILREQLGLNITIRNTFMVHGDTTLSELMYFIERSELEYADIAALRPFYIFVDGKREFITNEQVHQALEDLIARQDGGAGTDGDHSFRIMIQASKPDRLSAGFSLVNDRYRWMEKTGDVPLCLSPLFNISMNTDLDWGMCCDTKEIGLGGVPAELFGRGIPADPREYYLNALRGIVTLDPANCITGCGFMELNEQYDTDLLTAALVRSLKMLRARYVSGDLSAPEVLQELRAAFK